MHDVDFGMSFRCAARGMDVQAAKVSSELESSGDRETGEILVAEG